MLSIRAAQLFGEKAAGLPQKASRLEEEAEPRVRPPKCPEGRSTWNGRLDLHEPKEGCSVTPRIPPLMRMYPFRLVDVDVVTSVWLMV